MTSDPQLSPAPGAETAPGAVAERVPKPLLSGDAVLRGLRWALHTSVAALLGIGLIRAVMAQPSGGRLAAVVLCAVAFIGVYGAGLRRERRATWPSAVHLQSLQGWAVQGGAVQRYVPAWLAIVTALWAALLVLDVNFTWLAFPLFFLHMHVLRVRHAILSVTVLTAVIVVTQWWSRGNADLPTLLGPLIGAVCAVIIALAYQSLYAENRVQQAALEALRITREQLAESQRQAGALAERERLARDIHDTLAQGFSSVVLLARSTASSLARAEYGIAESQVDTIRRTASENLDEARKFVRSLASGEQDQQPLTESLRRACQSVEAQAAAHGKGLRCRLHITEEPAALPVRHGVALLRSAQASLSNVARHAQATAAVVTVTQTEDAVLLDVVDDGVGFDPDDASGSLPRADGSGYGMESVRERIEALDGTFRIESAPGHGTAVSIWLPRQQEKEEGP